MIYVVATIELHEGRRAEFLAAQRELLPVVRAESGCVEYTPSVDVSLSDAPKVPPREHVVVMHEKWETLDALRAHAQAPHMNAFRQQAGEMIESIKVEVFESA